MNARSSLPALAAAAAVAVLATAGCASPSAPPPPKQPYKVVLLPVEGAERALAQAAADASAAPEAERDAFVPLALTTEEFEKAVHDGVVASGAFSEIVVLPATAPQDDLAAAADWARSARADLLLRVTVKSAKVRDTGNNGSTFWSTLAWFVVPLPIWFSDDRTYDTNIAIEAALFEPRDLVKPAASVVAKSDPQDLDLWDRGLSPYLPLVPPPFLKGSMKAVSETVTERAMAQVMGALADELRTREIPSRFELTVTADGAGAVSIAVASRRALRSLEVFADGARTQGWVETELAPEPSSAPDRIEYRRTAKVPAGAAEVRVVVTDEAGGREVRTLVLARGGAK
ncbi:MAG: hypothetical protein HMLKMBBP_02204 [Planctomycetes bacterium]|nr:hypothetical protein [Planctomycetota bacterium]